MSAAQRGSRREVSEKEARDHESAAGEEVRDLVVKDLNGIENIMNLQRDASVAYDNLRWAIEANEAASGKISTAVGGYRPRSLGGQKGTQIIYRFCQYPFADIVGWCNLERGRLTVAGAGVMPTHRSGAIGSVVFVGQFGTEDKLSKSQVFP
ncbi:hypothetical protein M413DRAFT_11220 [Hebeloma cylindrosporum]|uniref:Uncharacterized protein n=1 Tax=Hebeloma cylindrosporum TaxID=76867 RepID=A0A0C3BWF3_HEBCY|nr:hypothetical protein M413DRAFT_11220 [Hebeloma cylindrosporum h7]